MIHPTTDTTRFINEVGQTVLDIWSPDFSLDWQTTLALPTITLITDGDGSYTLLDRLDENIVEGHVVIAPHRRRDSIQIARQMLDWIDQNITHQMLMAKTRDRHTRLWLRRLGLSDQGEHLLNGTVWRYFARFR